jgi:hypothetical protein
MLWQVFTLCNWCVLNVIYSNWRVRVTQVADTTVLFLGTNLYSAIMMSPLKHLRYKLNPLSVRHGFKSLTLFSYTVVVFKTFAAPSVNSLTFFFLLILFLLKLPSSYITAACSFSWRSLTPGQPRFTSGTALVFYLSGVHLSHSLWSHLASVVTSQSIFSTRLDVAAKSCGAEFTLTLKTSTSFAQTQRWNRCYWR